MTSARSEVVREGEVGAYHCVHRCVRRAFLCGRDDHTGQSFEHRRVWAQAQLEKLAGIFAIDVFGFALMANHLHVVLCVRPDLAEKLDAVELAARWWQLYPKRRDADGTPSEPTPLELEGVLDDRGGGDTRVAELRSRLASLSWFMRCLAEPIARRANKEDGCTGRFWEGRFKSQALLDEQAVLACSMYVDLNPIRAGIAQTPEASDFTSAKQRIEARQAQAKLLELGDRGVAVTHASQESLVAQAEKEAGRDGWLCPIGSSAGYLPSLDLDGYLALLDWTGREIAANKRGAIPSQLAPILERLQVDVERWIETVVRYGRTFRRAAGLVSSLAAEAARVSRCWLHGLSAARRAFRVA